MTGRKFPQDFTGTPIDYRAEREQVIIMDMWLINFLNGISFGMLLFLLAVGLSLVIGLMGILNLAHGSLYMVGAYVGISLAAQGVNFLLAALLAGVASGLVGLAILRGLLRPLYKQLNDQVLVTFGVVYITANVILWVSGPHPKMPVMPAIVSGSVNIGEYAFPLYRLALILIGLVVALGFWWLQEKTRAGAIVRAGMDNKEMTMGLGINYELVSTVVFVFSAFIVGVAGIIGAPMLGAYLGVGMDALLLAFVVAVVGGVGSVQGTLLGAMVIGLIITFGSVLFPDFAMFTIYVVFIIVLLFRPSGLLGRRF